MTQKRCKHCGAIEPSSGIVTASNGGVKVLRLQQLTGGTLRDEDGGEHAVSTAKRDLLKEMLADMDGEPVVVFARFHTDLDAIRAACTDAGLSVSELSGREKGLDEWQDGKTQVLAVQIQAGGVGISLVRASVAIYYSLGHSLSDYLQSRSRILGPMQEKTAIIYHMLAEGTIDEHIYRALINRQQVVESVVEAMLSNDHSRA